MTIRQAVAAGACTGILAAVTGLGLTATQGSAATLDVDAAVSQTFVIELPELPCVLTLNALGLYVCVDLPGGGLFGRQAARAGDLGRSTPERSADAAESRRSTPRHADQQPADPARPAAPAEPVMSAEPAEPAENVEPVEPVKPAEPAENVAPTEAPAPAAV